MTTVKILAIYLDPRASPGFFKTWISYLGTTLFNFVQDGLTPDGPLRKFLLTKNRYKYKIVLEKYLKNRIFAKISLMFASGPLCQPNATPDDYTGGSAINKDTQGSKFHQIFAIFRVTTYREHVPDPRLWRKNWFWAYCDGFRS